MRRRRQVLRRKELPDLLSSHSLADIADGDENLAASSIIELDLGVLTNCVLLFPNLGLDNDLATVGLLQRVLEKCREHLHESVRIKLDGLINTVQFCANPNPFRPQY